MSTVRQMLERYHAGQVTLDELARDFTSRQWPVQPQATAAQAWGVHDGEHPGDDSWAAVDADSRLTPDEYQRLAQARQAAGRR